MRLGAADALDRFRVEADAALAHAVEPELGVGIPVDGISDRRVRVLEERTGGLRLGAANRCQAQAMQAKINEAQKKLEAMEVEGSAGGGMVKLRISGKNALISLSIDPSLLKPEEAEIVEDLVKAAHDDARRKLEYDLRWAAEHDALTQLHNRAWFLCQRNRLAASSRR